MISQLKWIKLLIRNHCHGNVLPSGFPKVSDSLIQYWPGPPGGTTIYRKMAEVKWSNENGSKQCWEVLLSSAPPCLMVFRFDQTTNPMQICNHFQTLHFQKSKLCYFSDIVSDKRCTSICVYMLHQRSFRLHLDLYWEFPKHCAIPTADHATCSWFERIWQIQIKRK